MGLSREPNTTHPEWLTLQEHLHQRQLARLHRRQSDYYTKHTFHMDKVNNIISTSLVTHWLLASIDSLTLSLPLALLCHMASSDWRESHRVPSPGQNRRIGRHVEMVNSSCLNHKVPPSTAKSTQMYGKKVVQLVPLL